MNGIEIDYETNEINIKSIENGKCNILEVKEGKFMCIKYNDVNIKRDIYFYTEIENCIELNEDRTCVNKIWIKMYEMCK